MAKPPRAWCSIQGEYLNLVTYAPRTLDKLPVSSRTHVRNNCEVLSPSLLLLMMMMIRRKSGSSRNKKKRRKDGEEEEVDEDNDDKIREYAYCWTAREIHKVDNCKEKATVKLLSISLGCRKQLNSIPS